MHGLTRLERTLRALSAAALVVAAGALLWRTPVPTIAIPPAGFEAAPAFSSAPVEPGAGAAIVRGNIFSPSRVAPSTRYNVPGSGAEVEAPSEDATVAQVPRLYGTVVGPGQASALMRLDPGIPRARVYREGDRGGTYRVEEINEESVVLSGPRGRIVLRLIHPRGSTR